MTSDQHKALSAAQGFLASVEANLDDLNRAIDSANPSVLRAIHYDPSTRDPELWCDYHEQPIATCHHQEHDCTGWPVTGPPDPTGEAAVDFRGTTPDEWHRRVNAAVRRAHRAAKELDGIRAHFLTKALTEATRNSITRENDNDWCRSCRRDNGYNEPVSAHYPKKRLCRWCGDWAGTHNGELPPVKLIEKRHRGDKIYVDA